MSRRAALPVEAVSITPGYSWRLDLDILFAGERPNDWPEWTVRMHVWNDCGSIRFTLQNGSGVTVEEVADLPGADAPVMIPVIRLTGQQTKGFKTTPVNYLIDLTAPGGDAEDYFFGTFQVVPGPPLELIA